MLKLVIGLIPCTPDDVNETWTDNSCSLRTAIGSGNWVADDLTEVSQTFVIDYTVDVFYFYNNTFNIQILEVSCRRYL